MFITPVAGVYTAAYYFGKNEFFGVKNDKKFKALPLVAWLLGALAGWFTSAGPTGLELFTFTTIPSLDSFIIAFVAQFLFIIITKKMNRKEEEQHEMAK